MNYRALSPWVVFWVAALAVLPAAAQDEPRVAPARVLALTDATIYTMTEPGAAATEPLRGATILVRNGRIEAVGTDLALPDEATVVDLDGALVTPGLVDIATGVGLVEIWAEDRTVDTGASHALRPSFRARDGYNPDSELIAVTRTGGVTSVVSGPSGGLIAGRAVHCAFGPGRAATECAPADAYLAVNLGESGAGASGGSRGEAISKLREVLEDARYLRDNAARVDTNQARRLSLGRSDLEALAPVLDGTLPMLVQVHRPSDLESTLALTRELGLATPILAGATGAWEIADTLADSGAWVVVDPLDNLPARFESRSARADNAALLHAAGVPVIISTFDAHNVRNLRQLAGNAVRAGLPWIEALRAVTSHPADAIGLGTELGRIAPGYRANLAVWSGDPFEADSELLHLYVDGTEPPTGSHQKALFERYREPMPAD